MASVFHSAVGKDVGGLVVLLIPRLIVFVSNAEIEREAGRDFEIVLKVSGEAPLAVADPARGRGELIVVDAIENKVRRTIAGTVRCIRIRRKDATVTKLPEEADVSGVDVVLLIAGGLAANREEVASVLPGQVVVIIKSIVGEDLKVSIGADVTGVVVDGLAGESNKELLAKGYADLLISGEPKLTGWIGGNAIVPLHASKTEAKFIHNCGREGVDKTGSNDLRWITIFRGEKHRDDGSGMIFAGALRIEAVKFI